MKGESVHPAPDLSVALGPLHLANPVLVASGTFGYGHEIPDLASTGRLGGIVTKTITLEPRAGNPPPRLAETPSGLLNSIGLQNVGVERFLQEKLPPLTALHVPIIVSVGGRGSEEFAEVARHLDQVPGVAALELNVSCPNVEGGLEFCQVPQEAARVVSAVRGTTRLPLLVKLSPNVTHIGGVARACEESGADALTAVNTFVGLSIDPRTRRSRLAAGRGGLSGPAIRPLALAKVLEVVRSIALPVVGVGGIGCVEDALEFLIVGATAVEVGTEHFRNPRAGSEIVEGLEAFLRAEGISSLREVIGTYREEA